ncbi:MAG TPA: hypothetical protein VJ990_02585 [Clostridia bacterium]|nr:hypothetical protein [Clostridia bacterium]
MESEKMKLRVERFMGSTANEKGQGMVEYVLAITSISLVALLNLHLIGTWLDSFFGSLTMLI